jgi:hypothetical protein
MGPLPDPSPGDCTRDGCDGAGNVVDVGNTDIPPDPDLTDCLVPSCPLGSNVKRADGAACTGASGASVCCDGACCAGPAEVCCADGLTCGAPGC